MSKSHRFNTTGLLQRYGGFNLTSPFQASALQSNRYFWASCGHQGADLHAVIQLQRIQQIILRHDIQQESSVLKNNLTYVVQFMT